LRTGAIYGVGTYGTAIYGDKYALVGTARNSIFGIKLGNWVRKQVDKGVIFRVMRGNGYAGSIPGEMYQHRYKYFVPSTITHVNGDASRSCFADAVSSWQNLTDSEKEAYQEEAVQHHRMSGYNLFIREYMLLNYSPA
jgi:hypothetical protein